MSTIVEEQQVVETPVVDVPTISEEEGRRREVLLRAAELIEIHGWTSGTAGALKEGPYCLLGALGEASVGNAMYGYIEGKKYLGLNRSDVAWRWNDSLKYHRHLRPRRPRSLRRKTAEETVTTALRRMANGASWAEATKQ